jgi:hypothetical protein
VVEVPASRNPLRTRRLEQLAFRMPHDATPFDWPRFLTHLDSTKIRGRGAVVGPHGSGKTTFLVELKQRLEARGREVVLLFTNRNGKGRVPEDWIVALRRSSKRTLVIADGYDAIGPLSRWQLRRIYRPRGGLIVTAHRRCALPTLLQTHTSQNLLAALVDELFKDTPGMARPTDDTLRLLYEACRGNLREVFQRLYHDDVTVAAG